MRLRRLFLVLLAGSASGLVGLMGLAACSSDPAPSDELELEEGDASKPRSRSDSGTTSPGTPSTGTDPIPDAAGTGRVFAHTDEALYLFEPIGRTLSFIGNFSCLNPANEAMIDIAIDRTGAMYGTTFDRFLSIDPQTATCTDISFAFTELDYPNALSFVPAGTVNQTKEALVGYAGTIDDPNNATNYVSIDVVTGDMEPIGSLNPPGAAKKYRSSGDFVSLIQAGNKTYLTVKEVVGDAGSSDTDYLAEVDPKTGAIKEILGDTKQSDIYGLGYWAGKAYGFDYQGQVSEIDPATGEATVLLQFVDDAGAARRWYGAGVTTLAPAAP